MKFSISRIQIRLKNFNLKKQVYRPLSALRKIVQETLRNFSAKLGNMDKLEII